MLFFGESTFGKYLIYIQLWRKVVFTVLLPSPISKMSLTDIIQSMKRILKSIYDVDNKAPNSPTKS